MIWGAFCFLKYLFLSESLNFCTFAQKTKKTMEKEIFDYFKTINISITISDTEGNVLYMNDKSQSVFGEMIGKNMMGCHQQRSQDIIHRLLKDAETNVYTIEKGTVKKMIYQTPWFCDDQVAGLIEFSIVLPEKMPHYVRKP